MDIAAELRHKYNLSYILKIVNIPSTTFYRYLAKLNKPDKDAEIKALILEIFYDHKCTYGSLRVTAELRSRGYLINHKKVYRLMHEMGLKSPVRRAKYKSYKGCIGKICGNLLLDKHVDTIKHKTLYKRNFKTSGLNQKWVTDVTEFHIASGKVYLSAIMELYNREIIGYDVSYTPNLNQVLNMLKMAIGKFDNLDNLIIHSDQGWQYQQKAYQDLLKSKNIRQSMSRKGNCLDNSMMENFFGILKTEMFYGHEHEFTSLEMLKRIIEEYICYYNEERISAINNWETPSMTRQNFTYNLF